MAVATDFDMERFAVMTKQLYGPAFLNFTQNLKVSQSGRGPRGDAVEAL
jgi:hypothetical protein